MIALKANSFDLLAIEKELELKVGGIKELTSKVVLEELASAIFTLSGKAFIRAMNLEAKSKPKSYHHIYEWNKVGQNQARLFFLYKDSVAGGVLVVKPGFIQSRSKVPVAPELMSPGKTGKRVAAKYVFRDKATIMENGKPIIYRASKNLPMPDNGQIRFVAAGTVIRNMNPGGKQVKGSFEKFFNIWFNTKVDSIINASGMIQAIDNETAAILNKKGAGSAEIRKSIVALLRQYSKGEYVL
jgi:hypothetical protein